MTQRDAVYHKHPASKFIHFPPVCAARPLVAAEPRGSRVQCLRMNFAPGLGPPPMQLLRPLRYSLQHKNLSFN